MSTKYGDIYGVINTRKERTDVEQTYRRKTCAHKDVFKEAHHNDDRHETGGTDVANLLLFLFRLRLIDPLEMERLSRLCSGAETQEAARKWDGASTNLVFLFCRHMLCLP